MSDLVSAIVAQASPLCPPPLTLTYDVIHRVFQRQIFALIFDLRSTVPTMANPPRRSNRQRGFPAPVLPSVQPARRRSRVTKKLRAAQTLTSPSPDTVAETVIVVNKQPSDQVDNHEEAGTSSRRSGLPTPNVGSLVGASTASFNTATSRLDEAGVGPSDVEPAHLHPSSATVGHLVSLCYVIANGWNLARLHPRIAKGLPG